MPPVPATGPLRADNEPVLAPMLHGAHEGIGAHNSAGPGPNQPELALVERPMIGAIVAVPVTVEQAGQRCGVKWIGATDVVLPARARDQPVHHDLEVSTAVGVLTGQED